MAVITWDMPAITPTADGNISEFSVAINDLNNKLIAAGLIDYSGENVAALASIMNFVWPATMQMGYKEYFLCRLKYKLPTGNGKKRYENIPGSEYKKIVEESYDSTECNIEFEFGFTYNLSNTSNADKRFLILYNNVKFYNNDYTLAANSKYKFATTNYNIIGHKHDQKCIIVLTGKMFHLFWYNRNIAQSVNNNYMPNYVHAPLIFFTFIRENNKFYLFSKKDYITATSFIRNDTYEQALAAPNSNSPTLYPLDLQELHLNGSATRIRELSEFCKKIDINTAPITTGSTKAVFATYYNLSDEITINPYILRGYVGFNYPPAQQIDNYEVDLIYDGVKTRMKYYNSGRLNIKIRSTPMLTESSNAISCTFLIYVGDHPCTTNHL